MVGKLVLDIGETLLVVEASKCRIYQEGQAKQSNGLIILPFETHRGVNVQQVVKQNAIALDSRYISRIQHLGSIHLWSHIYNTTYTYNVGMGHSRRHK
jgi:hypothetical protein